MKVDNIEDRVFMVQPGDRVVLELPPDAVPDPERYKAIFEQMKKVWPDNECVVVLGHLRIEKS